MTTSRGLCWCHFPSDAQWVEMQVDGERQRKEKIKGKRRGLEAVNQPVGWTPKKQSLSKMEVKISGGAISCSVVFR